MKKFSNQQTNSEDGFSIIELIVSMVIFMIVIGTIYGLMQVGLIDRNRASRRSDVLKNARAKEPITDAGFAEPQRSGQFGAHEFPCAIRLFKQSQLVAKILGEEGVQEVHIPKHGESFEL